MTRFSLLFILCILSLFTSGQPVIAEFEVMESGEQETLVQTSLEGIWADSLSGRVRLVEKTRNTTNPVAFQIEPGDPPRLWWRMAPSPVAVRRFQLLFTPHASITPAVQPISYSLSGGQLTFLSAEQPVLTYQFEEIDPPAGVSQLYTRGGFIHPLYSPSGAALTRIQPPDHYHHVGVWNPWTKAEFEGREIDFWNLYKGEGTVKPVALTSATKGNLFGAFRAVHEYIDLNGKAPEGFKKPLTEVWDVKVFDANIGSRPVFIVDFTTTYHPATDSVFTVKAYRYQGFGYRATASWHDGNTQLRTSEGKDKETANATRARWIDVRGPTEAGTSGIVFMTHPANHDYPELLRIWPVGANEGEENVFINFNPAQESDWVMRPGQRYVLKYRMLVYDGAISPNEAQQAWQAFARPPIIRRVLK
jgi:hypothetical protein